MKAIVQIVEKVVSEAHIYIPDGMSPDAIKQYITDRYNSGELTPDLNIFRVNFESLSATIINNQNTVNTQEDVA